MDYKVVVTAEAEEDLLYCFLDIKICSSYDRFLDISIVYHMGSISKIKDFRTFLFTEK